VLDPSIAMTAGASAGAPPPHAAASTDVAKTRDDG